MIYRKNDSRQSCSNAHHTGVAKSTLVSETEIYTCHKAHIFPLSQKHIVIQGCHPRTEKIQGVEHQRLESVWKDCSIWFGWSERAIKQSMLALAESARLS